MQLSSKSGQDILRSIQVDFDLVSGGIVDRTKLELESQLFNIHHHKVLQVLEIIFRSENAIQTPLLPLYPLALRFFEEWRVNLY